MSMPQVASRAIKMVYPEPCTLKSEPFTLNAADGIQGSTSNLMCSEWEYPGSRKGRFPLHGTRSACTVQGKSIEG